MDVLDRFLVQQAGHNRRRGFGETVVLVEDAAPLPPYQVPCFRMARLARDLSCRGQGMGSLLLGLAQPLLVDAKDETAAQFSLHHGFRRLQNTTRSLDLPLGAQQRDP